MKIRENNREVNRFLRTAEMYDEAVAGLLNLAPAKGVARFATVAMYLTGYIVECSLKAWVLSETPNSRQSRLMSDFKGKKGHDLVWLRDQLAKRGVRIPRTLSESIRRVSTRWSTDLRYDPASRSVELAHFLARSAKDVLNELRSH